MIGKFFVFAFLSAVAFAQESVDVKSDLLTLKSMTEDGSKRVMEIIEKISAAPQDFDKLVEDRICSLQWETVAQKIALNKSIAEAIFKGMMKNKALNNFQCVSQASREAFDKLDAAKPQIPELSMKVKEKGLAVIKQFGLIIPGFHTFCEDLYKQKSLEMNKVSEEAARSKILREVSDKMIQMKKILQQVEDFVNSSRFKFLEDHIFFAYEVENNLRKIQKEAVQKIFKCVN